jgi:AP-3 complex subunit delta-1
MWERNLQDLIRGLRAHKNDESKFIASAIDDIRQEVKNKDMDLKAAAVLKLTYVCPDIITVAMGAHTCRLARDDGI